MEKKNNGKYKQFLRVIMIQINFKYLFATSVKCSDHKISPFVHKLAKTVPGRFDPVVSALSRFGLGRFDLDHFGQFWWVVSA